MEEFCRPETLADPLGKGNDDNNKDEDELEPKKKKQRLDDLEEQPTFPCPVTACGKIYTTKYQLEYH